MKPKYEAILYVERPKSKHIPLTKEQRAAQFSPFAALKGYEESIKEEGREVIKKIVLSDDEKEVLNNKINYLLDNIENLNYKITYFEKDLKKNGGKYITTSEKIKKIDVTNQVLVFDNKVKINLNDINDIEIWKN